MGLFRTDYMPQAVLPQRRITEYTIKADPLEINPKFCPHCGAAFIEGKDFCVECGNKKYTHYTMELYLPKNNMRAPEVADFVNDWLAQNPYLYNIQFEFDFAHWSNDFDRSGSTRVKRVMVSYNISDKPLPYQYGLAFIYRYTATLNFIRQNSFRGEDLVNEWAAQNPHVSVITYSGGRTTSTDNTYQYYQFVTYCAKPV